MTLIKTLNNFSQRLGSTGIQEIIFNYPER